MSQKIYFIYFKRIFLLELNIFISSHPVTSKQPHIIVQILLGHPVNIATQFIPVEIFLGKGNCSTVKKKNLIKSNLSVRCHYCFMHQKMENLKEPRLLSRALVRRRLRGL